MGQTGGGLPGGFRPVNLADPSPRETADPEGEVNRGAAGRDDRNLLLGGLPEAHDGPVAKLLVDGREGEVEGLVARCGILGGLC